MKRRLFIALVLGGALVGPRLAKAQKQTSALIGLLTTTTPDSGQLESIRKGLAEHGYVENRNFSFVSRSAEGQFGRLPALAQELIDQRVSVILAYGSPVPARSAKALTNDIPIVFAYGGDPVVDGLVSSLNKPGSNVTGATFLGTALSGKKLELLGRLLPRLAGVALLVNRKGTLAENQIRDAEQATKVLGQRLLIVDASTAPEIETAFETIGRAKVDALMVGTDPTLGLRFGRQIVALAERYAIPTIYPTRLELAAGGLMSYGASFYDALQQAGLYTARILDGEKPADLPIIQPTRYELAINLKSAKALGLTIPPSLLALADEVIE